MKCEKCGNEINDTLLLCPTCGNILKDPNKENNGFSCGITGEKKVVINPNIPNPNEVKKSTLELLTNVQFYLTNFFYILFITLIFLSVKHFNSTIGFELSIILIRIGYTLIANIPFAIYLELFFNKIDVPIGLACIPVINCIVYYFSGIDEQDKIRKYIIEFLFLTFILSKIPESITNSLVGFLALFYYILSIASSVISLILVIVFAVRANYNYSKRFGFGKVMCFICALIPLPMHLIVIFDKNRVYIK